MKISGTLLLFLTFFFLLTENGFAQLTNKVVIVVIDGARYSETFGDDDHEFIPGMSSIAEDGTIIDEFYNDGVTYTYRAVPALWCGAWTEVNDTIYNGLSTNYAVLPSLFEYFRKQSNAPAEKCYYVLPYIESLWLPSFDEDYGPDYWPQFHSAGETDSDVCNHAKFVINSFQPRLLWVYLADVDHGGHSGNWNEYTQAIKTADSIVGHLWETLQSNPFYANQTTMIVTNDHGRHDNQHGGFQGHGCGCDGCRHILFLAIGPGIKQGYISTQYRQTPDMAVTACEILNINPEKATGDVISEIFEISDIQIPDEFEKERNLISCYPVPVKASAQISIRIAESCEISLDLMDITGKKVNTIFAGFIYRGLTKLSFNTNDLKQGIYFLKLESKNNNDVLKVVISR